jgi:two-component system chemotaxis response regulator CheY
VPPSPKKILVVDDDPDTREAVAASISDLGVEVLQARDGVEGLAHLAGDAPSAILLDMRMPRLDGDGFLRALRGDARLATIPVITMTGGPEPALEPPVASHLHKPFDPDELARILVSLCEVEPETAGEPV